MHDLRYHHSGIRTTLLFDQYRNEDGAFFADLTKTGITFCGILNQMATFNIKIDLIK
ncbi:hypothetical protein MARINOS108_10705 [Marinoscillum sp. 108]|jgi:hypothetical protein|nr:hypothetical protein MARINOS108_10705 [Marinoscillum sp. 108]